MDSNYNGREEKMTPSSFKGQVNSKSQKSKGIIEFQGDQRCEEITKVVNFIFQKLIEIILSF